jgi:hypothetical protein
LVEISLIDVCRTAVAINNKCDEVIIVGQCLIENFATDDMSSLRFQNGTKANHNEKKFQNSI